MAMRRTRIALPILCLALLALASLIPVAVLFGKALSPWILPVLMAGFLVFGALRQVPVYEVFVDGAKEGFQVALRIIPYLVAILVAVGMLRASGALDLLVGALAPVTGKFGLPAEALPMALMRPLSVSGAYGILASIINDPAIGPDAYTGVLVSTLQGSTETTFYVMAVYFGAVQVRRIRHAMAAALTADAAGIIFAVLACGFLPALLFQFRPMRIDHHGWQIVCVAFALWAISWRDTRKGGWVAGLAMAELDRYGPDDDWFIWLSFPDPHHPWDPPQSELARVP